MNEDWEVLMAFLPSDWRTLAADTGALKGLRKDKSVEHLLRTLLLHLGCGHSLRETVVRARKAHLSPRPSWNRLDASHRARAPSPHTGRFDRTASHSLAAAA